jgi:hypothetical protein
VQLVSSITSTSQYALQWKKQEQSSWDGVSSKQLIVNTSDSGSSHIADDCEPGTTYCVRIVRDGKDYSNELVVDTEPVGCTPGQKQGCCVIS